MSINVESTPASSVKKQGSLSSAIQLLWVGILAVFCFSYTIGLFIFWKLQPGFSSQLSSAVDVTLAIPVMIACILSGYFTRTERWRMHFLPFRWLKLGLPAGLYPKDSVEGSVLSQWVFNLLNTEADLCAKKWGRESKAREFLPARKGKLESFLGTARPRNPQEIGEFRKKRGGLKRRVDFAQRHLIKCCSSARSQKVRFNSIWDLMKVMKALPPELGTNDECVVRAKRRYEAWVPAKP